MDLHYGIYGLDVMGGVDIQEETIVGELVNVLKCFIYVNQFRHSSIGQICLYIFRFRRLDCFILTVFYN